MNSKSKEKRFLKKSTALLHELKFIQNPLNKWNRTFTFEISGIDVMKFQYTFFKFTEFHCKSLIQ